MSRFSNRAQLFYQTVRVNSNLAVGEIQPSLRVEKIALQDSYRLGDTLWYLITLINTGHRSFSELTVTDSLGAYLNNAELFYPLSYQVGSLRLFLNGIEQSAPALTSVCPLTISPFSVPENSVVRLLYAAKVNSFAPLFSGATIENTVVCSTARRELQSATAIVKASDEASLMIAKSVSPNPVSENGRVTYSFVILNTGNRAVSDKERVIVKDRFQPVLRDLSVMLNGVSVFDSSQYEYDSQTGQFSTEPGAITVPATTYSQDAVTGEWIATPGSVTLSVSGILAEDKEP